jgi:hypothetical protein
MKIDRVSQLNLPGPTAFRIYLMQRTERTSLL